MTEPDTAPTSRRWTRLALGLAVVELLMACVAYTLTTLGLCPAQTGGLSCAALIRPDFAWFGPFPVALVGVVGAALTVILAVVAQRAPLLEGSPWLARAVVGIPAAGAGFVLGLQALPIAAKAGVCPVCLAVALSALGTAIALAVAVGEVAPKGRAAFTGAFTTVLMFTVGAAALHGIALGNRDAVARMMLEQLTASYRNRGRLLLVVERSGCPYCESLRLDVLGRDQVSKLLDEGGWQVEFVSEADPRALEHAGGRGAPVLIAFDKARAKRLGRVRGYRDSEAVASWLSGLPE